MALIHEVAPGLWRWTARHPEWAAGAKPGGPADWPADVGCIACALPDALVLIDPLIPPEGERYLAELDDLVTQHGRPVVVLTTIKWHRRSREELVDRYAARTARQPREMPEGVEAHPIRGAGETVYWLPEHRALVPGDRILGSDGGRLRLCPESWLRYLSSGITVDELCERLWPLLELPVEMVLVSHGEPVLAGGREALEKALSNQG